MITIVWMRRDLRIGDNPALSEAAARGEIVPVFILDEAEPLGGAGAWWLHHSLTALSGELDGLVLRRGQPRRVLEELAVETGASAVFWNRLYEPDTIRRDKQIKQHLSAKGLEVRSFNGSLICEPWDLATKSGGPFKVYSPFWRALSAKPARAPERSPVSFACRRGIDSDLLADWRLAPVRPNWAAGWDAIWRPGEAGGRERLEAFLDGGLAGYRVGRDRPDQAHVSRLSAHLHFGEISVHQVWAAAQMRADRDPSLADDAAKFLAELGWREFAHHLLYHFPTLPSENWRSGFDHYPWRENADELQAWQQGMTGYPLVDAGMRELWQTGYMHNRVRMVCASFLVKHLQLHWRSGEAWFRDTLVDADLANNAAGWQWVAGSGADAAPYFRIFNPIAQGRKFDPDGDYVRRWCPELATLDDKFVHAPFEASPLELAAAGIELGETYPWPIVDHGAARARALDGYAAVKAAAGGGGPGG